MYPWYKRTGRNEKWEPGYIDSQFFIYTPEYKSTFGFGTHGYCAMSEKHNSTSVQLSKYE